MSKVADERFWYLAWSYARGGWQAKKLEGVKKWDRHHENLLKSGFLEADADCCLYRITDKGIQKVAETKYRHFLPKYMRPSGDATAAPEPPSGTMGQKT